MAGCGSRLAGDRPLCLKLCLPWLCGLLCALAAAALVACGSVGDGATGPQRVEEVTPASLERGFQQLLGYRDLQGQVMGQEASAKLTAVVVFASWCRYCRQEIDVLRDLSQVDSRLRLIGVNYYEKDDGSRLRAYLRERAPGLRVVRADTGLWAALGRPTHVPTLYLFNGQGRLVAAYIPPHDKAPTMDELRERVAQLLSA